MSEQLKHIFDASVCPTKRQMNEYLAGTMMREEVYAFEHHVNSCFLCSEAIDGMLEHKENALVGMSELNNNFLKDHLELHPPQIHLNSIAQAATVDVKTKTGFHISWRQAGLAAAILLCLGTGWYFKNTQKNIDSNALIAANELVVESSPQNSVLKAKNERQNFVANKPTEKSTVTSSSAIAHNKNLPVTATQAEGNVAITSVQDQSNELATTTPSVSPENSIEETTPTRNANEAISLAGNTYGNKSEEAVSRGDTPSNLTIGAVDGMGKASVKDEAKRKRSEAKESGSASENADKLYEQGKYARALAAYKKDINSSNERTSQRAQLMAAKCYLSLGQKQNAEKLLRALVENGGGSVKRQAKKMLRDMENAAIDLE